MTTTTPKTLSDLRYQDNVLHLKQGESAAHKAGQWFREVFGDGPVTTNHLFNEDNQRVFEAYTDPGSIDYLYLVVPF